MHTTGGWPSRASGRKAGRQADDKRNHVMGLCETTSEYCVGFFLSAVACVRVCKMGGRCYARCVVITTRCAYYTPSAECIAHKTSMDASVDNDINDERDCIFDLCSGWNFGFDYGRFATVSTSMSAVWLHVAICVRTTTSTIRS